MSFLKDFWQMNTRLSESKQSRQLAGSRFQLFSDRMLLRLYIFDIINQSCSFLHNLLNDRIYDWKATFC